MDVRTIWPEWEGSDKIGSADLIDRLKALGDSPWGDRLSAYLLSKLLSEYGIKPRTVRFPNGYTAKGYERFGFTDAWARYLEPVPDPVQVVTTVTSVTTRPNVTDVTYVTDLAGEVGKVIRCGRKGCRSAAGPSGYCHSHIPLGPCDICGEPMLGSAHLNCLRK